MPRTISIVRTTLFMVDGTGAGVAVSAGRVVCTTVGVGAGVSVGVATVGVIAGGNPTTSPAAILALPAISIATYANLLPSRL
ncbi:Uncharacterised protein [uncultured archaeon]|nr:Uncharacterised protein [uncultured archaeon]